MALSVTASWYTKLGIGLSYYFLTHRHNCCQLRYIRVLSVINLSDNLLSVGLYPAQTYIIQVNLHVAMLPGLSSLIFKSMASKCKKDACSSSDHNLYSPCTTVDEQKWPEGPKEAEHTLSQIVNTMYCRCMVDKFLRGLTFHVFVGQLSNTKKEPSSVHATCVDLSSLQNLSILKNQWINPSRTSLHEISQPQNLLTI